MYLNENLFKEFIRTKEILWLGIDFSKAKFTKDGFSFKSQDEMRTFFNEWNMLIIADQKKYDIRMSFRKPIMSCDLAMLTKANRSVRLGTLMCDTISLSNVYNEEKICEHVRKQMHPQQHRFSLEMLVESFDSRNKTGSVWVIVADTVANEPVLCEKFLKNPGGFGMKNYWGRIFYNVLYDIKNYAFCRWEDLVSDKT